MAKEIKPGVIIKEVDSLRLTKLMGELPDKSAWECCNCGNIMTSREQPKQCCKCGVRFL